ncbi:hypothetical protein A9R00_12365 [Oleispira antarctica]|uniref:DUF4442 domain-containing protein n=1 Tax=Oleispira antarctica TaxID=188908 RepID=A0A1Y5HCU7_OLEAN|nr:hypothetical protein A9R00_12365 [Oleispira antarctica]
MKALLYRWFVNLAPAYRRCGARVTHIATDYKTVKIKLDLTWKTRNHLNMIWGGSLYSALDPIYGVMLHKILGPDYYVVDKSATIHFKRPARGTVYGEFKIDDSEIAAIKEQCARHKKIDRVYQLALTDKQGTVHVMCEKTLHIRLAS